MGYELVRVRPDLLSSPESVLRSKHQSTCNANSIECEYDWLCGNCTIKDNWGDESLLYSYTLWLQKGSLYSSLSIQYPRQMRHSITVMSSVCHPKIDWADHDSFKSLKDAAQSTLQCSELYQQNCRVGLWSITYRFLVKDRWHHRCNKAIVFVGVHQFRWRNFVNRLIVIAVETSVHSIKSVLQFSC